MIARGRLRDPSTAPATGEEVEQLLAVGGVVVEQILSGELAAPVDYCQDHDEWVALLAGSATLVVDGEQVELTAGDTLFLASGVPHRLMQTAQGSSWLAIHL